MPRSSEKALNALISEVFRLNGIIIAAGDHLTKPFGLSSARWQVMGAITLAGEATVAELARRIGVTRQSVQRIVTEMVAENYAALVDNPSDRRAKNVALTIKGKTAYDAVSQAWAKSTSRMTRVVGFEELVAVRRSLALLRDAFQAMAEHPAPSRSDNRLKED